MAKTPNGATTPYATPQDFIDRMDVNFLGDLAQDDDTTANPTQLLTNTKLAAALTDASGMVEMMCLQGERYTAFDLQALNYNGLGLLKRIVCGLAMQFMRSRRGVIEPGMYPEYDFAMKMLDMLADGKAIFPMAEVEAAGLPDSEVMQPADFYQGLPTLLTNQTRYWGTRQDRRFNH